MALASQWLVGAEAMTAILSIEEVSKRFRGLVAVDRLGFQVEQGRIVADGPKDQVIQALQKTSA